jgi:hypothetical protein
MALAHSDLGANAALDALLDRANASTVQTTPVMTFATGADPGANVTTDTGTLLGTLALSTTAFAAATGRTKTLNAVPITATLVASGTPAHYRILDRAATRLVTETGTVGTSGADINFSSTTWLSGGTITLTSYVVTAFA